MRLSNPVTSEVRIAVIRADLGRCVAQRIHCDRHQACRAGIWPGPCRDVDGSVIVPADVRYGRSLTLDHVQDTQGTKKGMTVAGTHRGARAPSDPDHLATICDGHSERGMQGGAQWNTAHRPELRTYLRTHR